MLVCEYARDGPKGEKNDLEFRGEEEWREKDRRILWRNGRKEEGPAEQGKYCSLQV